MIFTKALNEMCDGKKLTRVEWDNKDEYGLVRDDKLQIHTKGKFHDWIVSYADMLAEDWEIVRS